MSDYITHAKSIIKNNSRGNFTIPCDALYPFQWNWDSVFSALGIYMYDSERAISELKMLLKGQLNNGMIPHIIFHNQSDTYYPGPDVWESDTTPETSLISQPPVLASIIWQMMMHGYRNEETLSYFYNCILKYHKWFIENRDPHNIGLISVFHPWESGRDNSPDWDDAMSYIPVDESLIFDRKDDSHIDASNRPTNDDYNRYMQIVFKCKELDWNSERIYEEGLFNVCDPGIQFIFIRACKDLYRIASFLHKDDDLPMIERWITEYSMGCECLWHTELKTFTSLNIKTNRLFEGISSASLLYAYADVGTKEQREEMLFNTRQMIYYSKYCVPSFHPNHMKFDCKKYWRGPIWCVINYLLYKGFTDIREVEIANTIKKHTIALVERNGFYEYFDPYTGEGYGGNNFSWTAAIYVVLKKGT